MVCPECGKQAYVLNTEKHRPQQGEPLVEYRRYVCEDWTCNTVFMYRNTFFEFRQVDNVRGLLRNLKRKGNNLDIDQEEIEFEED